MRLGIFSDSHLGVSKFRKISNLQNTYSLVNNEVFKEAINILIEEDVDAILIAGDLFNIPNPSVQSIKTANRLSNLDIPVFLIGGNHDFSQKDHIKSCHPFDLLYGENIEFAIDEAKIIDLKDCDLTLIPYKYLTPETFSKIYRGKLNNKKKNSILMFHGNVDLNNSCEESEYILPKEVAENYDLVISGHTHLPNLIKTNSTSILVSGSLMPSSQANGNSKKPSVYIYNTENKDIKSIELKKSPKIFDIITDDVNYELEKISNKKYSNDLYFIRYNGKNQDIDELLYKKASQNVLNLSIQSNNNISIENNIKVEEFWKFVEDNHPEYYDEFKEFLKGE